MSLSSSSQELQNMSPFVPVPPPRSPAPDAASSGGRFNVAAFGSELNDDLIEIGGDPAPKAVEHAGKALRPAQDKPGFFARVAHGLINIITPESFINDARFESDVHYKREGGVLVNSQGLPARGKADAAKVLRSDLRDTRNHNLYVMEQVVGGTFSKDEFGEAFYLKKGECTEHRVMLLRNEIALKMFRAQPDNVRGSEKLTIEECKELALERLNRIIGREVLSDRQLAIYRDGKEGVMEPLDKDSMELLEDLSVGDVKVVSNAEVNARIGLFGKVARGSWNASSLVARSIIGVLQNLPGGGNGGALDVLWTTTGSVIGQLTKAVILTTIVAGGLLSLPIIGLLAGAVKLVEVLYNKVVVPTGLADFSAKQYNKFASRGILQQQVQEMVSLHQRLETLESGLKGQLARLKPETRAYIEASADLDQVSEQKNALAVRLFGTGRHGTVDKDALSNTINQRVKDLGMQEWFFGLLGGLFVKRESAGFYWSGHQTNTEDLLVRANVLAEEFDDYTDGVGYNSRTINANKDFVARQISRAANALDKRTGSAPAAHVRTESVEYGDGIFGTLLMDDEPDAEEVDLRTRPGSHHLSREYDSIPDHDNDAFSSLVNYDWISRTNSQQPTRPATNFTTFQGQEQSFDDLDVDNT